MSLIRAQVVEQVEQEAVETNGDDVHHDAKHAVPVVVHHDPKQVLQDKDDADPFRDRHTPVVLKKETYAQQESGQAKYSRDHREARYVGSIPCLVGLTAEREDGKHDKGQGNYAEKDPDDRDDVVHHVLPGVGLGGRLTGGEHAWDRLDLHRAVWANGRPFHDGALAVGGGGGLWGSVLFRGLCCLVGGLLLFVSFCFFGGFVLRGPPLFFFFATATRKNHQPPPPPTAS